MAQMQFANVHLSQTCDINNKLYTQCYKTVYRSCESVIPYYHPENRATFVKNVEFFNHLIQKYDFLHGSF